MSDTVLSEIMDLQTKSLEELKAKYEELFESQKTNSSDKTFLWRRLAYRIQEINYGGHSENIRTRIDELIDHYDPVNNKSLRSNAAPAGTSKKGLFRDKRLPIPGTIIVKKYKGQTLEVKVLERGFEFNGKAYKTLSAIANELTGTHWNGYIFFGL